MRFHVGKQHGILCPRCAGSTRSHHTSWNDVQQTGSMPREHHDGLQRLNIVCVAKRESAFQLKRAQ